MTKYIQDKNLVNVFSDDSLTLKSKLDNRFYKIYIDPKENVFLETVASPEITEKLYGEVNDRIEKVLTTFKNNDKSLGALFIGNKGTGKSLTVNLIALKANLPVIILDKSYPLSLVIGLMEKIEQEYVFIIDEIDKKYTYNSHDQDNKDFTKLLNFMSGSGLKNKVLILITGNDIYNVNRLLINRPGRVHYRFNYSSLSNDQCVAVINDNIKDSKRANEIIESLHMLDNISYDSLTALIKESLLYNNISVKDLMKDLNIKEINNDILLLNKFVYKENGLILPVYGYDMPNMTETYFRYKNDVAITTIYTHAKNGIIVDSDTKIMLSPNDKDFKISVNSENILTIENNKYKLELLAVTSESINYYSKKGYSKIESKNKSNSFSDLSSAIGEEDYA